MLLQVIGTRPQVTTEQALQAVASQFGFVLDERYEMHKATHPHDFFLLLPGHGEMLAMLAGDRTVRAPAFQMKVHPWNRLVNAEPGALYHKVEIELEGVPLHVWEYSTAADLLRPYCSLESLHPDTAERRDLSVFRLTAWTTRPELIPETRPLMVPEPMDNEAPFQPMRRTLRYLIWITVRRLSACRQILPREHLGLHRLPGRNPTIRHRRDRVGGEIGLGLIDQ